MLAVLKVLQVKSMEKFEHFDRWTKGAQRDHFKEIEQRLGYQVEENSELLMEAERSGRGKKVKAEGMSSLL